MTALAAVWSFGAGDPASEVAQMLAGQAARGPDGAAQLSHGQATLGRALRWTLPEDAHDKGPILLRDGKGVLIADVRIDNRVQLEGFVRVDPPRARTMSDAELVGAAIARWGESAVDKIVGDYAFIWWDPANARMVLARDFLGTRPLEVARGQGFVAAGSRIEGGDRVPPGHVLMLTHDGGALRRWWRPTSKALGFANEAEYAAALQEQLDLAVRSRLRGAGDAVALLDTGDPAGAAIAASARPLLPGGVRSFRTADESPDWIGFEVALAPRLGALTIGYTGTEHLPPQLAKPPLAGFAHLIPGVTKRVREARIAQMTALDLADSMDGGDGPDLRDPTADWRLTEFCLSVPDRIWAKGLAGLAFGVPPNP